MDVYVELRTAKYLRMSELARWRAVDTTTKSTFDMESEENAWQLCAQAQFGCDRLFALYCLYSSPQRQLCFKFHSMLQRANYMLSSVPLIVEHIEGAALIERQLRQAFSVSSAHRAVFGRGAQVLLGSVCLRGKKETLFQFGGEETPPLIAGLPPGVLAVRMCLKDDRFMIWAAYGEMRGNVFYQCQRAARMQFTFDICSADQDVSMSFRGVPLVLDGRWRSCKCSTSHCPSSQSYKGWPVLCVFSIFVRSHRAGLALASRLR
eukprot:TRINITY_DN10082_c0_g1_i1.p1 TRINITY_DN10082_c0_g1~~TRINITY_DN10082_c0_g1_i1.p1  ORF type:complete len:263 (-),score=23.92 TRINITY_DN10082_c0_g1_i1:524-1312(-)